MEEAKIANLVYRYADHVDHGRLDAAARLLGDARVLLDRDAAPLTPAELLTLWRKETNPHADGAPKTRHLISNPLIDIDNDRATCEAYCTVVAIDTVPPQIIASGRWRDEFVRVDGSWQFALHDCSQLDTCADAGQQWREGAAAAELARPSAKSVAMSPTKTKILDAAQQIFSTVGYSEAGMRKIAEMVGVSPTILFRNFNSKAELFEAALVAAMGEPKLPNDRATFGRRVADMLAATDKHICPHAMTVLATGNEEAREIATRVLQEYALMPMAEWLGAPNAESRARQILALCAGFALYYSRFKNNAADQGDPCMVEWLAHSIQAVVDQR